MPLILNGASGISGIDGHSGSPPIKGVDTDTGMFFPAANTIAFTEGGSEAVRIDDSGRVLIGNEVYVSLGRIHTNGTWTRFSGYLLG